MKRHRLVLDTNVLVSALIFPTGSLTWIRDAWHSKKILPLASRATTTELLRVFAYPRFRLSPLERDELLADYLPYCEAVAIPEPRPSVPACRDPSDDSFLELAVAGEADALVTGDLDLLSLADSFAVPILTPEAIKARVMGVSTSRPE